MAKPNFSFKKRQREQAKEQKRKEKAEKKAERAAAAARGEPDAGIGAELADMDGTESTSDDDSADSPTS